MLIGFPLTCPLFVLNSALWSLNFNTACAFLRTKSGISLKLVVTLLKFKSPQTCGFLRFPFTIISIFPSPLTSIIGTGPIRKFNISCNGTTFSSAVAKSTCFVLHIRISEYLTLYNSTPPFTHTHSIPPAGTSTSKLTYLPVKLSFTVAPFAFLIGLISIPLFINTSPFTSGS